MLAAMHRRERRSMLPGQALGRGRIFSSSLVQSALQSAGIDAVLVDARECIITDAAHGRATPLWEDSNARLQADAVAAVGIGTSPSAGWICRRDS